ncbi:CMRF35-like molecule 7 [Scleropages formosus]|uniref:CMRF35-like molecule 7 n=1 Tax=Scleropages formosus TaxID=113540 RepID=UPI0010FAAD66|nr:CMRF35-like molecule 7 [Scleropages formosus]
MVRTDSPQRKGKVSITDNPDQLVFTVTMRKLQETDSDWYWCGVESDPVDDCTPLFLEVRKGIQSVRTRSWISAESGMSVTIRCHYDQKYKHHVKYWCKGYTWLHCTTIVRTDSPQSKGEVSIHDDPNQLVFNVTMRNLQEKDSDWYWCVVEIDWGSDDGVFLQLMVKTRVSKTNALFKKPQHATSTKHSDILSSTTSHPTGWESATFIYTSLSPTVTVEEFNSTNPAK